MNYYIHYTTIEQQLIISWSKTEVSDHVYSHPLPSVPKIQPFHLTVKEPKVVKTSIPLETKKPTSSFDDFTKPKKKQALPAHKKPSQQLMNPEKSKPSNPAPVAMFEKKLVSLPAKKPLPSTPVVQSAAVEAVPLTELDQKMMQIFEQEEEQVAFIFKKKAYFSIGSKESCHD